MKKIFFFSLIISSMFLFACINCQEQEKKEPSNYCGKTMEEVYQKFNVDSVFLNYNLIPKKFKPDKLLTKKMIFTVRNNPYNLDEQYKIQIYITVNFTRGKSYVVYKGIFQEEFFGYFPELKEKDLVLFHIAIYSPYEKEYSFFPSSIDSQVVVNWDDDYKEIAIVFVPDRREIHFYPICF